MNELEPQIRQGRIADFAKLNQEWAWSPESEWQQIAQKDYIKGIEAGTQEFWVLEKGSSAVQEVGLWGIRQRGH